MSSHYTTTQGTKPHKMTTHEPRTIERHNGDDLFMMTEIGDGVFVQWGQCRKCDQRVKDCKCSGGPVEPDYMTRWRDQRFERELNARPEPDREALPKVIAFLRERGYTVTKKGASASTAPDEGSADNAPADDAPSEADSGDELAETVDKGLDAALEKTREARAETDSDDVGF